LSEIDLIRETERLKRRLDRMETNEPSPIACRVYNDANFTHNSTGNWLAITFNSERWDTTGMHEGVTNPSRITFALGGWYLVGGNIVFAANDTGIRGCAVRLGGSTYIGMKTQTNSGASTTVHITISILYYFAATNYVELMGFQDSGGNLNINTYGNYSLEFWAIRMA